MLERVLVLKLVEVFVCKVGSDVVGEVDRCVGAGIDIYGGY